ncbi:MAG: hypothetical protein KDB35_06910, partial [Acidimicrobiales bacterium]|nr:hypothetical protein [Acidimicrobiales bacterium]
MTLVLLAAIGAIAVFLVLVVLGSFTSIGPSEVGLVTKRIGKKLDGGQLVALNGEAGYQADLLMPGLRFKIWPVYKVRRFPWV